MYDYDELIESIAGAVGAMLGVFVIMLLVGIALWVLQLIGAYKAFKKTGQPAYISLIPMANEYVMGEFSGAKKDTMILLLLETFGWILSVIPFVGGLAYAVVVIVFLCKQRNAVAKSFGYDVGMTVLLVLLPTVAWIILGFGNCQYVGPSVTESVAAPATTPSSDSDL